MVYSTSMVATEFFSANLFWSVCVCGDCHVAGVSSNVIYRCYRDVVDMSIVLSACHSVTVSLPRERLAL